MSASAGPDRRRSVPNGNGETPQMRSLSPPTVEDRASPGAHHTPGVALGTDRFAAALFAAGERAAWSAPRSSRALPAAIPALS